MNINNLKFTEFYDFIAICYHILLYVSAQNQIIDDLFLSSNSINCNTAYSIEVHAVLSFVSPYFML